MDPRTAAAALTRVAELLELRADNPFKTRPYPNAPRARGAPRRPPPPAAAALTRVAELLELRDDNPFKTRAYHNAARALSGLDLDDLGPALRDGALAQVPRPRRGTPA